MSESPPFLPTSAELKALPEASDALPLGTRLAEFEIREVIGVGGFGIVYRAWDLALEREVAIKEYMPGGMVGRAADAKLALRSRGYEEDFKLGLRSFVNEARLLARFDHPSLVKVYRFWEANDTAYMAMPFYRAQTLRKRRQDMETRTPTQDWLLSMIRPLLDVLEEMHRADVYHRDIAPDNILWCVDGRPVLLDFGAARHVLGDRTQTLTAILKPQFAPIEQYADTQSMRQGPWTDVFALASTCYFMLTGRPPLPATARILRDDLAPLAQLGFTDFSPHVLATLDWAMAVRPEERPQSMALLRDALEGLLPVPQRAQVETAAPSAHGAGGDYEKTIQTAPRATAKPRARVVRDGSSRGRRAPQATPSPNATGSQAFKSFRWLLLALAVVTSGTFAWLLSWHQSHPTSAAAVPYRQFSIASQPTAAPRPPAATASSSTASTPAAVDAATALPRHVASAGAVRANAPTQRQETPGPSAATRLDAGQPRRATANEDSTARAEREEIAWAAAHEASAPARSPRPHAASPASLRK